MNKKTDSEIQEAVLQELRWDPRVQATEIGVTVDHGVVTLTGDVSSWAKRIAALDAAHRVQGVLDVANDIAVKPLGSLGRTDTAIAAAVRHALEWDVFVPHETIRSTVSGGWVVLEGEVPSATAREDAEKAIRNLSGVHGVSNNLMVKPSEVNPIEMRQAIQAALERQADLRARRITLELHDGLVKVRGAVQSWNEKQAALAAVRGTHGVREVEDMLRIEP